MSDFSRTAMIIGDNGLDVLRNSHVAIFGVGGVGSFCAEAIARCGVGKITLIDDDTVSETNINRQLIALNSTMGMSKVEVMKMRISDINPDAQVNALKMFYTKEEDIDVSDFDYIVDAIDTVTSKLLLIETAYKNGVGIISSMGAGNKLHPELFEIDDIYNTSVCPLARVMRRELKKRGVNRLKVVYSKEEAIKPTGICNEPNATHVKRATPGSISFVPSAAGLIAAGEVIRDLISK